MIEEPLLLLEHLIQTSIQRVLFYQRKIFIQQISHCALLKPLPMQPPFAARINESIADQGLQNMLPASSLSTIGQTLGPEIIQAQLLVKITGQPTGSPLPAAKSGSCRSAGNNAKGRVRSRFSSKTSIVRHQLSC